MGDASRLRAAEAIICCLIVGQIAFSRTIPMLSSTRLSFSDWLYEHPLGAFVRAMSAVFALYVPALLSHMLHVGELDVPLARHNTRMAALNAWLDYANVFIEPFLLFIVMAHHIGERCLISPFTARTETFRTLNTLISYIIILVFFLAMPVVWNCIVSWRSRIINEQRFKDFWIMTMDTDESCL
ncbi:hypothetical protein C8F04DRAFT_683864 [Mycena alexandri]|uniref:Uncharacterized protein n=1 Tax=Mycena alexandri TaxID=1745969 RepID=A0AAD6TCL8_9AGAR|nr:hypothetical protein C8F04DRAFT_683864 [Mycena alexandri]